MALTVETEQFDSNTGKSKFRSGWALLRGCGTLRASDKKTPVITKAPLPFVSPISTGRHITEEDNTVSETVPSYSDDDGMNLPSATVSQENKRNTRTGTMTVVPVEVVTGRSHSNGWSKPRASEFHVRGPSYLSDRQKVPSEDYLIPCQSVDLFLTGASPHNLSWNTALLGGRLRDRPTLVINFRLPWGVLLLYGEIPAKFVPYVESSLIGSSKRDDDDDDDDAAMKRHQLELTLMDLSPAERTLARWFMADATTKSQSLKIIPLVVEGPWMVQSVVSGKPALIGSKVPISYYTEPARDREQKRQQYTIPEPMQHQAPYLEVALDIGASTAARSILSVAKSYTQALTLNLGFVIQGNQPDELSEQMLMGVRLHGIDPSTAPDFPDVTV